MNPCCMYHSERSLKHSKIYLDIHTHSVWVSNIESVEMCKLNKILNILTFSCECEKGFEKSSTPALCQDIDECQE